MSEERLLVVDDDAQTCDFVREVAGGLGYVVEVTRNAKNFRRRYADFQPTAIVLDLALPDEDGVQLLKFLRNEGCDARIIVVSGLDEQVRKAVDKLAEAYGLRLVPNLAKPCQAEALRNALKPAAPPGARRPGGAATFRETIVRKWTSLWAGGRPREKTLDRDLPNQPPAAPSAWVERFASFVPGGAPVLDVACGDGRHARLLHARGHPVTAIDRDASRFEPPSGEPEITVVETDLETGPWPLADARFGGVVVTNYLHRPLFPALVATVAPGGVLIYETFAEGNERLGKPRNPDHLLRPGELLEVVRGTLRVVAYEALEVSTPRPAVVQRICAVKA